MNTTSSFQFSLAQVKDTAKEYGYTVRVLDGEIEAYPKGLRGDASYFECNDPEGRASVRAWIKTDFTCRFRAKLDALGALISDDAKDALIQWHVYHGAEWLDKLIWQAWYSGRYDGFATSNVSSSLQRLRNSNGHAVIKALTA